MTKYLLDTNVFISAHNFYYSPDICPAFWDWIILQNEMGGVTSIDRVFGELSAVEDGLYNWSSTFGFKLFEYSGTPELESVTNNIETWLAENEYSDDGIYDFALGADIWLIAYALSYDKTLVTHEKSQGSKSKIKIPNVCKGLNIPCVTTFEMLRTESVEFILKDRTVS